MTTGSTVTPFVVRVPPHLVRTLAIVIGVLIALHVILQTWHYRIHEVPWLLKDMFDVDGEDNIPTWFSSFLLLLASTFTALVARVRSARGDRDHRFWFVLALGLLVMSIDEVAGFHESLNSLVDELGGGDSFTWTIPGAVLVAVVGVAFMRFLGRLPEDERRDLLIAGLIYVTGVVLLEYAAHSYLKVEQNTMDTLTYNLMTPVEEGLEMTGALLMIRAALVQLRRLAGAPTVDVAIETAGTG